LEEKPTIELFLKFIEKPVLKIVDESTFLLKKFLIKITSGFFMKKVKECYLGITIDHFLVIWHIKETELKEKGIEIINSVSI